MEVVRTYPRPFAMLIQNTALLSVWDKETRISEPIIHMDPRIQ
jgi:hypothetical protein